MTAPIAVALDAPDLDTLSAWAFTTAPYVSTLKVGLEVFCRDGVDVVHSARESAIRAGAPDTKIFSISSCTTFLRQSRVPRVRCGRLLRTS